MLAEDADRIVCLWSMKYGVALTETAQKGLVDMLSGNQVLEELPVIAVKWPCASCGSSQAPGCNVDESGHVTDCSNCVPRSKGEHLEDAKCWCHPELSYIDEVTGTEVWAHRELH